MNEIYKITLLLYYCIIFYTKTIIHYLSLIKKISNIYKRLNKLFTILKNNYFLNNELSDY